MLSRLNLTAVLAVLAILDLVGDRVIGRLFLPATSLTGGARVLGASASFVSYLAGALALLLFASSFLGAIRRRELYPRSMRLVVSVLALVFVALMTACLATFQVQHRWFVQLKTAFAFFAWLTAVAVWRAPVGARAKVGVTLFALPPVLHTAALFVSEMGWGRAATASDLARIGELGAFIAAGAAPLLLPERLRPTRLTGLGWALGLLGASLVMAGVLVRFDLLQALALYGLRLDVPPLGATGAWGYAMLFALAVLGIFLLVVPALAGTGSDRLMAYGAVMMVTAGYQIASPTDLGVSACGMLALALGVSRRVGVTSSPDPQPAATPAVAV